MKKSTADIWDKKYDRITAVLPEKKRYVKAGELIPAGTREISQEHSEWGHCAFTKAIIEGLEKGMADYNGDGIIYLIEVDTYVSERVKELTNGKQHSKTYNPQGLRCTGKRMSFAAREIYLC